MILPYLLLLVYRTVVFDLTLPLSEMNKNFVLIFQIRKHLINLKEVFPFLLTLNQILTEKICKHVSMNSVIEDRFFLVSFNMI